MIQSALSPYVMQFAYLPLQAGGEEFEIDPTFVLAVGAILLLVSIAIGYWVYKDASKRENNEVLWALGISALLFLTGIFGIIGLVAYFLVRSDVVEEQPTGTEVAGNSWDADTSQNDADDADW